MTNHLRITYNNNQPEDIEIVQRADILTLLEDFEKRLNKGKESLIFLYKDAEITKRFDFTKVQDNPIEIKAINKYITLYIREDLLKKTKYKMKQTQKFYRIFQKVDPNQDSPNYLFFFEKNLVDSNSSPYQYGLHDNDIIEAKTRKQTSEFINFSILEQNGNETPAKLRPTDKISSMINQFSNIIGRNPEDVYFIAKDTILSLDSTIAESGIEEGTKIEICTRPEKRKIQLLIHNIDPNLPFDTIKGFFDKFGNVLEFQLLQASEETTRSKAFVFYRTLDEANRAIVGCMKTCLENCQLQAEIVANYF